MIQLPIARDYTFRWMPHYMPSIAAGNPTVTMTANGVTRSYQMTAGGIAATINSITNRERLFSGATSASNLAGRTGDHGGATWWFYSPGVFAVPVKVSYYDDSTGEYVLSEPLPFAPPANETGSLFLNVWAVNVPAGDLGAVVDRAGVWNVDYIADLDFGTVDQRQITMADRGRLRVVRTPFSTGLTARQLTRFVPQLTHTRPQTLDTWQPLIELMDPISEIEAALPLGAYADQTIPEQWQRFHALLVAWHIASTGYAPGVDPEAMRAAADDELARQAARLHLLDADDDGVVDAGEAAIVGTSLVGITASSAADTRVEYDNGTRVRRVLTDLNDR